MAVWSPSKASKLNHIFIYIHSLMSENDKNVPLIVCDFHTKWGKRHTLSFFKRGDFKVSYLKFWEWLVSCEKSSLFSTPLEQPNFPGISYLLFILMLSFWQTFQNNLNHASTSNIREVIKFYDLGGKTFETDFSFVKFLLWFLAHPKILDVEYNIRICPGAKHWELLRFDFVASSCKKLITGPDTNYITSAIKKFTLDMSTL